MSNAHGRQRKLDDAITNDDPSLVQIALGRFKGAEATTAAKFGAELALKLNRWDNLAFLSDFLNETTVNGGANIETPWGEMPEEEVAYIANECRNLVAPATRASKLTDDDHNNIFGCVDYVVRNMLAPDPPAAATKPAPAAKKPAPAAKKPKRAAKKHGGDSVFSEQFVAVRGGSASSRNITFSVVDLDAPAGTPRSQEQPDDHVYLTQDLEQLEDPNAKVALVGQIDVLYNYPLGTKGPTEREQQLGGWVFTETAPNGQPYFTRADLVRAIANRYRTIYAEEAAASDVEPGYVPGMYSRVATNGPYGIYGHVIDDLALLAVSQDLVSGMWILQVDA